MNRFATIATLCLLAACDAPATDPLDQAHNLDPNGVNLTLAVRGRGEVVHTADQAGATSCSTIAPNPEQADCVRSYALNTVVTLQPKPAPGFAFDHWGGRCRGTTTCTTTMNERVVLEAIFKAVPTPPTPPTLTIVVRGRGEITHTADQAGAAACSTVAPNPEQADCVRTYALNTVVTLAAKPAPGFTFDHWGGRCTGNGPCTLTMNERLTLEAIFKPVIAPPSTYTVRLLIRGRGEVKHTADQSGATSCAPSAATPELAECVRTFPANSTVVLDAQPAAGLRFTGWSGVCTGTAPCTLRMNESRTFEVKFQT